MIKRVRVRASTLFASLILLFLPVVVSACNGAQGGPVPTNTSAPARSTSQPAAPTARPANATANPTAKPNQPPAPPVKVTPLAVSVAGIPAGSFRVSVTGAMPGELSGQAAVFIDAQGAAATLSLSSTAANSAGKIVTLVFPQGIQPGSYPILPYLSSLKAGGGTTGIGANYTQLANGADVYASVSGTVTLQSVNPFTGAFTFKGTNKGKEIVANGVFNQVQRKR